jgi:hypothetical protein
VYKYVAISEVELLLHVLVTSEENGCGWDHFHVVGSESFEKALVAFVSNSSLSAVDETIVDRVTLLSTKLQASA